MIIIKNKKNKMKMNRKARNFQGADDVPACKKPGLWTHRWKKKKPTKEKRGFVPIWVVFFWFWQWGGTLGFSIDRAGGGGVMLDVSLVWSCPRLPRSLPTPGDMNLTSVWKLSGRIKVERKGKKKGWWGTNEKAKPSTSGNLLEWGHNCITSKI